MASPGDLDSIFNRFRQIGKQRRHFVRAFEIMFRRQPHAVVCGHHNAFRDTAQRIMGLEIVPGRKKRLVGGHQRQGKLVGKPYQMRLDAPLPRIIAAAVTLNFDIQPVTENAMEMFKQCFRTIAVIALQQAVYRPLAGSGQADNAIAVPRKGLKADMGT